MEQHKLDSHPIPQEEKPLFINEPWLIDKHLLEFSMNVEPDDQGDNVRIYIPMDLNQESILRRLDGVIAFYGAASESNESDYNIDVMEIISQIEIYDQVWAKRHMLEEGEHSQEAIDLVQQFVARLQEIEDECAERFPFDIIEELEQDYLYN